MVAIFLRHKVESWLLEADVWEETFQSVDEGRQHKASSPSTMRPARPLVEVYVDTLCRRLNSCFGFSVKKAIARGMTSGEKLERQLTSPTGKACLSTGIQF